MATHELKTLPEYFIKLVKGQKTFEWRKNDRDFKAGDELVLCEWNEETQKYTGRIVSFDAGFIVYGGVFGIPEGYCIISLL